MAKILFGSYTANWSAASSLAQHLRDELISAGHTLDFFELSSNSAFNDSLWDVTDQELVIVFYYPAQVVHQNSLAAKFQTYTVPKIYLGSTPAIASRYTTDAMLSSNQSSAIWWLNSNTPMTTGLGGTGYPTPVSNLLSANYVSAIRANTFLWDFRAHLVEGDYALITAFEYGDIIGSYTVPARTVLSAMVPNGIASDLSNLNQGYVDFVLKSVSWAVSGAKFYSGSGGFAFGGDATTGISAQYPVGGLILGGSSITFKQSAGIVAGEITGSGGLLFAGRATTAIQLIDIRENERWSNIELGLEETFLYTRLFNQRTPFVAKDRGPHIFGNLLYGLDAEDYTLSYNPTTGEFSINGNVHFTKPGVSKVDFTFDDRGFPIIAYELNESIWLYSWSHPLQEYTDNLIAAGTQPFICFYGTRINSTGEPILIYLRGSQVVTRRGSENFSRVYATSAVLPDNVRVRVSGLGQTPTDRLQANLRAIYERKVE